MMKRRHFLRSSLATSAAVLAGRGTLVSQNVQAAEVEAATRVDPIKQSVTRWTYSSIPLDDLAAAARDMGLLSVELLDPDDWPIVQRYGLTCAMANAAGPGGIPRGFNRPEHHEWLIPAYETLIRQAADAGVPNVICFSGNRDGLPDQQGIENCARGLSRLTPLAERLGVTIAMELLNSKVNHPDYQCDHTVWGVALVDLVSSDRFKLLYDIYHMQIMEGDVIRTIQENHQHIAHYHTAGVPGRHELDESQELFYPAIMRAIKDTGFQGYVGQEFVPTRDPLTSLAEAVRLCDV
jgi:hydroxypyruvate isomerase